MLYLYLLFFHVYDVWVWWLNGTNLMILHEFPTKKKYFFCKYKKNVYLCTRKTQMMAG